MYGTYIKKLLLTHSYVGNINFANAEYGCNWCRLLIGKNPDDVYGIWNNLSIGSVDMLQHGYCAGYYNNQYGVGTQREQCLYKLNPGKWIDNLNYDVEKLRQYVGSATALDTSMNIFIKHKRFNYYASNPSYIDTITVVLNLNDEIVNKNVKVTLLGDIYTLFPTTVKDGSDWQYYSRLENGSNTNDKDLSELDLSTTQFEVKDKLKLQSNCITKIDLNFSNIKFIGNSYFGITYSMFEDCPKLKEVVIRTTPEMLINNDSNLFLRAFYSCTNVEYANLHIRSPKTGTYRPSTTNNLPISMLRGSGWESENEYNTYLQLLRKLQGYNPKYDPNSSQYAGQYTYTDDELKSFSLLNNYNTVKQESFLSFGFHASNPVTKLQIIGLNKTTIQGEGYEGSVEDVVNKILYQIWLNNNKSYSAGEYCDTELYYVAQSWLTRDRVMITYSTIDGWVI